MKLLINCDLGESETMAQDGRQERILSRIHLANVCCGAHAGSAALTRLTMKHCFVAGLRVGAHPGYPDPDHFGRRSLFETVYNSAQVTALVADQVAFAKEAAAEAGLQLYHVKPHGALYNEASVNGEVAEAIAKGVRQVLRDVVLVGLAGSVMIEVFRRQGFVALRESFADRRYTPEGLLVNRSIHGALIEEPSEARRQMDRLAIFSDTVCVHGDSVNAIEILEAIQA